MKFGEFAKGVHQNAVDHGWYDAERGVSEIFALIHSEWSEALEEYRAGRPMEWYHCCECEPDGHGHPCDPKDENDCLNYETREKCSHRGKKPEGSAVELIDGCIRILDFMGSVLTLDSDADDVDFDEFIRPSDKTRERVEATFKATPFPVFVARLHAMTTHAMESTLVANGARLDEAMCHLVAIIYRVFVWLEAHGCEDPKAVMIEKHEYNKSRPYRHGGKRC